jgi:hypothetical protein
MTMEFSEMAVVVTAYRRPYYLEETLTSWAQAIGLDQVRRFVVALGHSNRKRAQMMVVDKMQASFPVPIDIREDSPEASVSNGVHRALGEAVTALFTDPQTGFVVCGDEDIVVSDDILEYMRWAASRFQPDGRVIISCAHNKGTTGWDPPVPPDDAEASQTAVRLMHYFNPWVWGTWADRWADTVRPRWDWECNSGGANDSGYDHNIQRRILPAVGGVCTVPDASRSQNIGRYEGWASNETTWAFSQSRSFRYSRGSTDYKLVNEHD